MGILEWATSPLGQRVPIHIAWFLIWVALIAGLVFLVVHAIYVRYFAEKTAFAADPPVNVGQLPTRIPRHSLAARLFHWIMAAAIFVLLFTAFLPKLGFRFDWVTYHWIAGTVLALSIFFHIIHATFYLDFWSIWPDRADLEDARKRFRRFMGKPAGLPRKFAKYPLENKLYHGVVMLTGLAVIATGIFMMFRVRTILPAQSLFIQRYDLGPDVCAAWVGRSRADHSGHRSCLLRRASGEITDYCIDDRRLHEP
ncbi:MAG TPA: cytochrome b/b6 domain-containing protein [Silvibacterium sp.]|nr:cytochrome b/b6 domain-containing protein [Silvibacterium sp.]